MVFLTSMVVETLEVVGMMMLIDLCWTSTLWMIQIDPHSASVMSGSFGKAFCQPFWYTSLESFFALAVATLCLRNDLPKTALESSSRREVQFLEYSWPSFFLFSLLLIHSYACCGKQNWIPVQLAVSFDQYIKTSRQHQISWNPPLVIPPLCTILS